jgi:hypothetical protein
MIKIIQSKFTWFFILFHCWLIKFIVGKRSVIMNIEFSPTKIMKKDGMLIANCSFNQNMFGLNEYHIPEISSKN